MLLGNAGFGEAAPVWLGLRQSLQSTWWRDDCMHVRDGMSPTVLTVGAGHTLRHVARLMAQRRVGAAVVLDPEASGPAIITERDILDAVGSGQDMDEECVADHLTADFVYATPDWSL